MSFSYKILKIKIITYNLKTLRIENNELVKGNCKNESSDGYLFGFNY